MPPAIQSTDVLWKQDRTGILAALRDRLEQYRHHHAGQAGWCRQVVATGLVPLDEVLPKGGIPCGTVTEILAEGPGVGVMSLAMRIAGRALRPAEAPRMPYPPLGVCPVCSVAPRGRRLQQQTRGGPAPTLHSDTPTDARTTLNIYPPVAQHMFSGYIAPLLAKEGLGEVASLCSYPPVSPLEKGGCSNALDTCTTKDNAPVMEDEQADDGKAIVLIDLLGDFYPPAAWQQGIALERLIVLRVDDEREAFWAADQALRCPAVAAVIAPFRRLDERSSRRLQLAAESSGCLGLILMPALRRGKSFSAVQMLVEAVEGNEATRQEVNGNPSFLRRFVPCPSSLALRSRLVPSPLNPLIPESLDSSVPSSLRPFPPVPLRRFVPEPVPTKWGSLRRFLLRITLLKVREGMPVGPVLVDLEHETGTLPLPSLPVDRPVAQTG